MYANITNITKNFIPDDEQLLVGVHQPIITSEPGSDLQTISQNVSRTLSPEDNGRKLVCRSEHEALEGPKEAARQLVVHCEYFIKRTAHLMISHYRILYRP